MLGRLSGVRIVAAPYKGNMHGQVALQLMYAVIFGTLTWTLTRDTLTRFHDRGVEQMTATGRQKQFLWSDLRTVEVRGHSVRLKFVAGTVHFNLLLFRNSTELVTFVRSRMPPTAVVDRPGVTSPL